VCCFYRASIRPFSSGFRHIKLLLQKVKALLIFSSTITSPLLFLSPQEWDKGRIKMSQGWRVNTRILITLVAPSKLGATDYDK
jgi:hypothetical protein